MTELSNVPMNGRRLQSGHPEFDAKRRAELDRRVRIARKAAKDGDEARFREAWALQYIKDQKLHRQDGIGDFDEWTVKKLKRAPSTVRRRLALAESFSPQQVTKYGVAKLLLAQEYANRTVDDDDGKVDATTITFAVPRADKTVAAVPFHDVTEPELEAALKHQRSLAQRRARAALPEEQVQVIGQLRTALTPPGRDEPLVQVSGRSSRSGLEADTTVRLELRFADLEAVLERLAAMHAERPRGRRR